MRKHILLLLLITFSLSITAQKKEKIKGNKIVTEVTNNLGDFNSIEIAEDLTVYIKKGATNSYYIKADENLIDVIQFDIVNDVLKITTTHKITRSKTLEIDLTFDAIHTITLRKDAVLKSINKLTIDSLNLNTHDKSKFVLDIASKKSTFSLNGSSSGEVNLTGATTAIYLNDKSELKGSLNLDKLNLKTSHKSKLSATGKINSSEIDAKDASRLNTKNLKTSMMSVILAGNAEISVLVDTELTIYAKGKTTTNIYGNSKIIIDGLNDFAKILKKKK